MAILRDSAQSEHCRPLFGRHGHHRQAAAFLYQRQFGKGSLLLERGDQLSALLERCQAANLRNGRLIRSSQASANSMLSILRGNETPSLYDSRGSAARIGQQRPLSQA